MTWEGRGRREVGDKREGMRERGRCVCEGTGRGNGREERGEARYRCTLPVAVPSMMERRTETLIIGVGEMEMQAL